ncbi:MAG: alcohol dehydrogenase catalytic domain-containing protein [Planctomycetes bacterium]|nr:alcohol dehydrogenase catalytic domain-containing protein [Planctomycetota bacterium]
MHAVVYRAKEDFRLEEVATPTLGAGELLVQVEAVTVCGVDLRTFRHGDAKIAPPRILGHEFCGRVVESAASDASVQIGDRVVMYIVMACGSCRYCRDGRANLCLTRSTMSYQHDGAFAQYVRIPAAGRRQLYKVPDHVPATHAALCEPLACVLNAHSRMAIGFRDEVVVMGAGPIGVMHAVAARERGARTVILCDVSAQRLALCERFGFDHYIPVREQAHLDEIKRLTDGYGPSVVIVAVGAAQAQADALEMAAKGARVEFFGGLPKSKPTATLNTNHLHYKELLVSGSYSEKPSDFEAAQALVFSGRFPAAKLVTHELSLERMTDAFALMEQGSALKVCITPTV